MITILALDDSASFSVASRPFNRRYPSDTFPPTMSWNFRIASPSISFRSSSLCSREIRCVHS